jgi:hypothetical protein
MLGWFRRRSRGLAATVLLSLLVMGASLGAPHADDCHDTTCSGLSVAHDESAHRIRAARSSDDRHPLHCAVCHWVRTFSRGAQNAQAVGAPPEQKVRVDAYAIGAARTVASTQPPGRSPPASPDAVL